LYRLVLDGIFWIARTGASWRDLPPEFGKCVWKQFRRWAISGVFDIMLECFADSGGGADPQRSPELTRFCSLN
jgi:transposase